MSTFNDETEVTVLLRIDKGALAALKDNPMILSEDEPGTYFANAVRRGVRALREAPEVEMTLEADPDAVALQRESAESLADLIAEDMHEAGELAGGDILDYLGILGLEFARGNAATLELYAGHVKTDDIPTEEPPGDEVG